jgi:uncharacterized protein
MSLPDDAEIRALHQRLAPARTAFTLVYGHSLIVGAIAQQLLARLPASGAAVDADLVRAGSLLHDIGVYQLYDRHGTLDRAGYIRHGVLGHQLLSDLGLPESLCRFCSCHIGVGLTRDDVLAQGLPLPPADYLPESVEEELVMYADTFHSKSDPPALVTADAYAAKVRRFGEHHANRFHRMRARFGEPDLAALGDARGHLLEPSPGGPHG